MDTAALATALIGARIAQVQMAVAAKMLRMNADNAASIVQVIEAAQQNMDKLANVAAGVGTNLDVSV
jgi:2-keto-4-pentenoate hydratase